MKRAAAVVAVVAWVLGILAAALLSSCTADELGPVRAASNAAADQISAQSHALEFQTQIDGKMREQACPPPSDRACRLQAESDALAAALPRIEAINRAAAVQKALEQSIELAAACKKMPRNDCYAAAFESATRLAAELQELLSPPADAGVDGAS